MRLIASRHLNRISATGLWRTQCYVVGDVYLGYCGVHVCLVYRYRTGEDPVAFVTSHGIETNLVSRWTQFSGRDRDDLLSYGGTALQRQFYSAFARGDTCVVARLAEHARRLGSVWWLVPIERHPASREGKCMSIQRCFTMPHMRGRGLHAECLRTVAIESTQRFGSARASHFRVLNRKRPSQRGFQRA